MPLLPYKKCLLRSVPPHDIVRPELVHACVVARKLQKPDSRPAGVSLIDREEVPPSVELSGKGVGKGMRAVILMKYGVRSFDAAVIGRRTVSSYITDAVSFCGAYYSRCCGGAPSTSLAIT